MTEASVITTGDVSLGGAATQPDPWAVGDNLYVGSEGSGTLNVEAGGVVSNRSGSISNNAGSTGVTVVVVFGSWFCGEVALWNQISYK